MLNVNSVAVNTGIHVSFSNLVSSEYIVVGLLGHMVVLILVFKGISILFSIGAVINLHSQRQCKRVLFSPLSSAFVAISF